VLMEWPVPVNVGEVRSFVSTCSYYRRYVAGFATIAAPLHQLTKHGEPFVWNAELQQGIRYSEVCFVVSTNPRDAAR